MAEYKTTWQAYSISVYFQVSCYLIFSPLYLLSLPSLSAPHETDIPNRHLQVILLFFTICRNTGQTSKTFWTVMSIFKKLCSVLNPVGHQTKQKRRRVYASGLLIGTRNGYHTSTDQASHSKLPCKVSD